MSFASLVVLSFNRQRYLQQSLESLWANTHYPFQLIVVDDASDAETQGYIFGLVPRAELVREQLEAEVMLLPGRTDSPEMCCISAMECHAAGCMAVVGAIGALEERVDYARTGYACPITGLSADQITFVHYAEQALQAARLGRGAHYAVPSLAKYDYSVLAPQWLERFERELSEQG